MRRFVRSELTLVVHRGRLLPDAMRRERVTEAEIRAVVRQQGGVSLAGVAALVLETDGSFSMVADPAAPTLPDGPDGPDG